MLIAGYQDLAVQFHYFRFSIEHLVFVCIDYQKGIFH